MNYNRTAIGRVHIESLKKVGFDTSDLASEWLPVPVVIDLYSMFDAMGTNPVLTNAVKKCMFPGQRHDKSEVQDLQEAIKCIQRRVDLILEREMYE